MNRIKEFDRTVYVMSHKSLPLLDRYKYTLCGACSCQLSIMKYPMKLDSESSLICYISKLENHLIQQQNSEQQKNSQQDVTELAVFLTKQPNPTLDT